MTTELPYTDDDLRHEAAHQLAQLAEDPDFMGVGEAMETNIVPSTEKPGVTGGGRSWDSVLRENADDFEQFEAAQTKIHALINDAADLSEWAVTLGADGLEPDAASLSTAIGDQPRLRVHFAFHPEISAEDRDRFVQHIAAAMTTAD